jgi:HSP90 family molecular chaperone
MNHLVKKRLEMFSEFSTENEDAYKKCYEAFAKHLKVGIDED